MRLFLIILLNLTLANSLFSKDIESILKINPDKKTKSKKQEEKNIESVLKINPPIKYHLHQKYDEISKFDINKDEKESDYNFGLDFEINQELMTIDKLKLDIGTKFKGIN